MRPSDVPTCDEFLKFQPSEARLRPTSGVALHHTFPPELRPYSSRKLLHEHRGLGWTTPDSSTQGVPES